MSRIPLTMTSAAILCAVSLIQTAVAAPPTSSPEEGRVSMSTYRPRPVGGIQTVGHEVPPAVYQGVTQGTPVLNPHGINVGRYPQLNAPLYPSPIQNVPEWTGGTIITNQAFAPHELLYPHRYHSMYGPFYYKVKGSWILTPFGVRQHEQWKLQGTEVRVKYHSHYRLFSGFSPPKSY